MSGEPHYLSLRDLAYWQSRKTHKSRPGPRPTLGELHGATLQHPGWGGGSTGFLPFPVFPLQRA